MDLGKASRGYMARASFLVRAWIYYLVLFSFFFVLLIAKFRKRQKGNVNLIPLCLLLLQYFHDRFILTVAESFRLCHSRALYRTKIYTTGLSQLLSLMIWMHVHQCLNSQVSVWIYMHTWKFNYRVRYLAHLPLEKKGRVNAEEAKDEGA